MKKVYAGDYGVSIKNPPQDMGRVLVADWDVDINILRRGARSDMRRYVNRTGCF